MVLRVCDPVLSEFTESDAIPADRGTGLPIGVLPSNKVTLPPGTPVSGAMAWTVTWSSTVWPATHTAGVTTNTVWVLALLTVWMTLVPLVAKLLSPLYTAWMMWLP